MKYCEFHWLITLLLVELLLREFYIGQKRHAHYLYLSPAVNDKCPVVFSDFAGNLRAQKPNKAQTKRTNITGVQYFPGLWYCLRTHQREWCQLCFIIYPLFMTRTHNLRQLLKWQARALLYRPNKGTDTSVEV